MATCLPSGLGSAYNRVWWPPELGSNRLDVDASFSNASGRYGVRVVIRDDAINVVVASCWPNLRASSSGQTELIAILLGLNLAVQYRINKVVI